MTVPRGFTDLPSNLITQLVARPHDLWQHFLENGAFPNQMMPLFLHEINHHWFFLTPVGTALTILRNSSVDLLRSFEFDKPEADKATLLYFRYCAARRLFDAIFEGAALFHEFFVRPGLSRIVSQPSLLAYVLFIPREKQRASFDDNEFDARWKEAVTEYRLSAEGISDKCRLFECPIEGEGRATYLRGYLIFCHLYNLYKQNMSVLADHELFIAFIRSLLLLDPLMVTIILNEELSIGEWLQAIMNRFQQRLRLVSHQRTGEEAKKLEYHISINDPEWAVFTLRKDLHNMEHLLLERCFKLSDSEDYQEIKLQDDSYRYVGRAIVRLAIERGEVEVDNNKTFYLKRPGECFALGEVGRGVSAQSGGNGYCALYLLQQPIKNLLYQAGTNHNPLIAEFAKPIEQKLGKTIAAMVQQQEIRTIIEDGVDQTFEDKMRELITSGRTTLRDVLSEWSTNVEQFERSLALAPLLPNSVAHWFTAMRMAGFAGLFNDRDHVRSLALLGLLSSIDYSEEMARHRLSVEGYDFDKECTFLKELTRESGFPIIESLGYEGRKFIMSL